MIVDDTFVVVQNEHVETLHWHLNVNQFQEVSFTLEKESEGSLPFLDVKVRRAQNRCLKTAVFRKVAHSDRYVLGLQFSPQRAA